MYISAPGPTGVGLMSCHVTVPCVPVIEVASGEYGDLNPVLFEAVQGGLCSEEGKKNSSDESDSFCHSTGYNVCCTHTRKHSTHTVSYLRFNKYLLLYFTILYYYFNFVRQQFSLMVNVMLM